MGGTGRSLHIPAAQGRQQSQLSSSRQQQHAFIRGISINKRTGPTLLDRLIQPIGYEIVFARILEFQVLVSIRRIGNHALYA